MNTETHPSSIRSHEASYDPIWGPEVFEEIAAKRRAQQENAATPERDTAALLDVEQFTQLGESLKSRIDQAVQSCEFEYSPEIEEAIKGYYNDHYKAAMVIEHVIEQRAIDSEMLSDDSVSLDSFSLNESLEAIITEQNRYKQLERVSDFIKSELFAESSVGQTTITEQEMNVVLGLNSQLQQQAVSERLTALSPVSEQAIFDKREMQTNTFWEDSRNAGQLEFHNTPFIEDLAQSNYKLQTRSHQKEKTGDFRAVTIESEGQSASVHFSETFMSDGYKAVQSGKQIDEVTVGATVALPLAEIVKQLPYARGGEYGVVTLKSGVENKATIHDDANIFAFGGHHNPGETDDRPTKSGVDRTFYADKYDRQKAENYEIDFGQAMKSSTGNTSRIIILERDKNSAYRKQYAQDMTNFDIRLSFGAGEGVPIIETLDFDYGKDTFTEHGHITMAEGAPFVEEGIADMSANSLGIVDPRLKQRATEHYSYREDVTAEQQEQELRAKIRDMQRKSRDRPEYKGKIVAMLRSGTMAFAPRS